MAHAVVNAALALAKGDNVLADAAATGMIAESYYHKSASELTETEKQTVSTLATLAAGLAGGLTGDSTASVASGAQAGKTTVENNALANVLSAAEAQKKGTIKKYEESKKAYCELMPEACQQAGKIILAGAETGSDFIPIYGDIKSFKEAQTAVEYLAAAVSLAPGIGDVAGKLIKAAEKALTKGDVAEASRLINKVSDEIRAVQPLDVGSYKELKAREVVGDGLEHDHIPSFAALRKAKENELGRKLTPAEEKSLYQEATAVEVPRDVHQAGPTYGGKNTAAQVQRDAMDLCGAVCRDTDALRANMIKRGYDPKLVDEAVKQIIERNKEIGVIK